MHALKAARKQVLYLQITRFTSTKVQTLTREERRGCSGGGGGSRVFGRRLAQVSLPQARAPQARLSSKSCSKASKAAVAVDAAECWGGRLAQGSVPLSPVPKAAVKQQ